MPVAPRLPSGSGVGAFDGSSRVASPESEYQRMDEGDSNGNGTATAGAAAASSRRSPRASNGADGTTVLGGADEGPATPGRGDTDTSTALPYRTCRFD